MRFHYHAIVLPRELLPSRRRAALIAWYTDIPTVARPYLQCNGLQQSKHWKLSFR